MCIQLIHIIHIHTYTYTEVTSSAEIERHFNSSSKESYLKLRVSKAWFLRR